MPRRPGDFQRNDDVYAAMEKGEHGLSQQSHSQSQSQREGESQAQPHMDATEEERRSKWRTLDEMHVEAVQWRSWMRELQHSD